MAFGDLGFRKDPLAPFKDLSVGRGGRGSQKAIAKTQGRWWQFASRWWGYGKRLGLGHISKVKSTRFADRLDVGYEKKRGWVRVDPKMFGLVPTRMALLYSGLGKALGGALPKLQAPPLLGCPAQEGLGGHGRGPRMGQLGEL